MVGKGTAIDIGSHSTKVLSVKVGKRGVQVTAFAAVPAEEGPGAIESEISLKGVTCGLSGGDMNLRYSQVPPTPDWQLRNLMDLEIQDLAQQSGGELSADYNLLPMADPESGVDTVMLALARDEALERLTAEVKEGDGTIGAFTPNCVALYNAFLKCGPVEDDIVVCLANVGHATIDIALVNGQDLMFARNLTGGGKVLDDAIAAAFNVSPRKAETLKRDLLDLDPQSRGRFESGQAEKVTMAAGGAAGAIVAAIQSSLAFCKAQTKVDDLRLDKVLVSGGSARLRGVRGMLREALRCPVELFDPFANCDLLLAEAHAEQLRAMRYEAVVALGLAVGRADDTLYSLEILPAAVRRKRQFAEQTVWNIAAALLAALLLLFYAKDRQAEVEVAEAARRSAQFRSRQVTDVHDKTEDLIAANRVDRAIVEHLAARAVPLHGLLHVLRAVTEHLPPQLWITRIDIKSSGSGSARRRVPVVIVKGRGKEIGGVEVGRVLLEFSGSLRELEDDGATVSTQLPPGGSTVEFTFTIDFNGAAGAGD